MTTKETPLLHRHPLLPLPGSSPGGGDGGAALGPAVRRVVASLGRAANDGDASIGPSAVGVALTEQRHDGRPNIAGGAGAAPSTALIPAGNNSGNIGGGTTGFVAPVVADPHEELHALRGLASVRHVPDGRVIFTGGVAGSKGVVRISLRTAGEHSGEGARDVDPVDNEVDVDLSNLATAGASSFESPAVGATCFVDGEESLLHLRAVDLYGTVLSLAFTYPALVPVSDGRSFLLPLSPQSDGAYPHPGASVEGQQVCFPTPTTVAFALNPHLYCVDLGGSNNNGGEAVTRVWTNVHRATSDPVADASGDAAPTPSKKPRKSLGGVLSLLAGMGGGGEAEYEYDDDEDDGGGGASIPSIAALTDLPSSDGTALAARLATLHSDGSLRIWAAEPSRRDSNWGRLRIPSVQRVAVSRGSTWTSGARIADPPLPRPATWDRSRDALTLRGRCREDHSYEVALHVQCYSALRVEGEGSVYVLKGGIIGESAEEEHASGVAEMQALALPRGTKSVVDVSWSSAGDLMALLRQGSVLDSSEALYDLGQSDDVGTALAVYRRGRRGKAYAEDPAMPASAALACLGLNRFGDALVPSAEEELERYLNLDEANGDEAEMEGALDRAGLRAILRPLGRCRPSSLAVHRALLTLGLVDGQMALEDVRPATILSAVRRWKKRASFRSSSRALVPVDDGEGRVDGANSPVPTGVSVYHTFISSATKAKRSDRNEEEEMVAGAEAPEQAHRSRWVRLLSEIRRQEAQLDAVLRLEVPSASSSGANFLVRGSAVSVLAVDGDDSAKASRDVEPMAALDELAVDLLERSASDPELRRLLFRAESALYNAAAKATCLIDGWATRGSDFELLSRLELLGRSAAADADVSDAQLRLLQELARSDESAVTWLTSHASASPSVAGRLALSRTFGGGRNNAAADSGGSPGGRDDVRSAASVISSQLDSSRQLALARLLLVLGSPGGGLPSLLHSALSFALHSTALCWAIHQPSSVEKQQTILEHHISSELMTEGDSGGAEVVADLFSPSALVSPSSMPRLWSEPRVALRLLAPLLEFSPQAAGEALDEAIVQRRNDVAECLLAEASLIVMCAEGSTSGGTPPEALWSLASRLLLDNAELSNEYVNRVKTLVIHLDPMKSSETALPLCCSFILEAVQDALSRDQELSADAEHEMRSVAFSIAMKGHLWDEAFRYCGAFLDVDEKKNSLKMLVLRMVNEGAIGKLVDTSLSVVGEAAEEMDLFTLAAAAIEEAAIEAASSNFLGSAQDEEKIAACTNYWGCLYTLHASRGDWRRAAYTMDLCGKAIANSVSSSNLRGSLTKAASKKVMDAVCTATQACVHAISQVADPSRRYLLLGTQGDAASSQSRLHTQEDLERRATRARALRMVSMDEYAPDSVSAILESDSRDAIDSLARLGYFDEAIAVASDMAAQKGAMMNGVDWFDDSLKHILGTYVVPTAISTSGGDEEGSVYDRLQSRSKMAQIRASSSACALSVGMPHGQSRSVTTSSANASSVSSSQDGNAVQAAMAMALLQQYTTMYSARCQGLALKVADAILQGGSGTSQLPLWLKELCLWGIPGEEKSDSGLFAQSKTADPAGLMRLFIKHHKYGEACGVVTSVLAPTTEESSRLPEKGSVDYVPYDLIDMLWSMIENIKESSSRSSSADVKSQIEALIVSREGMEKALETHFASLKISEEGIKSARTLAV